MNLAVVVTRSSAGARLGVMTSRFLAALATAACICAAPAAARLNPAEQTILRTIDAEQERTVALLERMVNQNSGSLNPAGVKAVADMIRPEFEQLGFTVDWIDMTDAKRSGHFIARHKGTGRGKRMLLIAHLDTVFEPNSPFQHWERQGNRATGPGVIDDKGGIAVIIAALRAMRAAGTLRQADVTVVLTGDEEDPGNPIELARRDLIATGKWADVALDFEPLARSEAGSDMATVARRSSSSWTVRITAPGGHSSGIFSERAGFGANYEAGRIIDAFPRELREPLLTYSVGLIGGGDQLTLDDTKTQVAATGKTNIIASTAVVRGDIRAIDEAQIERTHGKMRAIVAQSLPGTKAEITFDNDGYPPMAPTPGNRALLARLNSVARDLGQAELGELPPEQRGAADISFVAKDVDGLSGLGAAVGGRRVPRGGGG